jgi:hypothetical protein
VGDRSPENAENPRSVNSPLAASPSGLNLEKYWLKKLYSDPPGGCHHRRHFNRPLVPW